MVCWSGLVGLVDYFLFEKRTLFSSSLVWFGCMVGSNLNSTATSHLHRFVGVVGVEGVVGLVEVVGAVGVGGIVGVMGLIV